MADEGLFGGGAAFGVYPQMGGRRRLQDPQASADVPFQGFRGSVAGLLGLLPDVANFMGRSPMPTETFGEFDYGPRQQLPYGSEFYLKELPLAPTSPVGQLAGQVGSFVPLSPMPAVRGAQTVGRMVGQRMAENVAMGRPSLPSMLAEPRASLFAVEPSAMMPKPQAQVSELGFYSAAEQAAMNLARNKGTGQSFLNDLMKAPDVKKDELVWTGLDDFLANKPNVTKQEVQDYLSGNRVDVQERQLSGRGDKSGVFSEFNPDKNQFMVYGEDLSHTHAFNTAEEADNFVKQFNSQIPYGPSKYDKYQLPGGDNYREILLTLPFKEPAMPKGYQVTPMQYDDGTVKYFAETPTSRSQGFRTQEEAQEQLSKTANNLKGFRENLESYKSSHFNEPNILAHIRVNDRVDADGKKMLLIEEIQSDWHQAGREKGYASKETKRIKGTVEEQPSDYGFQTDYKVVWEDGTFSGGYGTKEIAQEVALKGKSNAKEGVPDAPFKDTWYQLALKRVLKHAADNGYERVGLTTGKQQAQRFDLSKQVDEITVPMVNEDGTRSVRIDPTEGTSIKLMVDAKGVVTGYGGGSTQFSGKKLSEVIGKDIADKVMQANANAKFTGLDLSVGGEGMKKYYDEIYPKFLEKYGKKWDAGVGETSIKTKNSASTYVDYIVGRGNFNDTTVLGVRSDGSTVIVNQNANSLQEAQQLANRYKEKDLSGDKETIRYIDITPEMKGAVSKGQPLFAAAPVGSIGLGYQKDKADNLEETSPMYTDPFGNTIGSSIR